MKHNVPDEIVAILQKLEDFQFRSGRPLTDSSKEKLHTFLCGLESAIINPVNGKQVLVNPIPNEPDLSIHKEKTYIDRIKHINSVSARVRAMEQPEPSEEQGDFEELEEMPVFKSIFRVDEHDIPEMVVDVVKPNDPSKLNVPNPDLEEEIPDEADHAGSHK